MLIPVGLLSAATSAAESCRTFPLQKSEKCFFSRGASEQHGHRDHDDSSDCVLVADLRRASWKAAYAIVIFCAAVAVQSAASVGTETIVERHVSKIDPGVVKNVLGTRMPHDAQSCCPFEDAE